MKFCLVYLEEFWERELPKDVKVLTHVCPKSELLNIYNNFHVNAQVSSHEGIGLGFYESIAKGVPVISLNCPPHDEVTLPNASGWLIPVTPYPLPDDLHGIVSAQKFQTKDLTDSFLNLDLLEVPQMSLSLSKRHKESSSEFTFPVRLYCSVMKEYNPRIVTTNKNSFILSRLKSSLRFFINFIFSLLGNFTRALISIKLKIFRTCHVFNAQYFTIRKIRRSILHQIRTHSNKSFKEGEFRN